MPPRPRVPLPFPRLPLLSKWIYISHRQDTIPASGRECVIGLAVLGAGLSSCALKTIACLAR